MAEDPPAPDDAEPAAVHPAPVYPKPTSRPPNIANRSVSVSLSDAVIVVAASQSDAIVRPLGPNDVIFGRGGASNNHVGNRRYRALVAERQPEYVNARKRDKAEIAREIVRTVTGVWGGLFVRKLENEETGAGGAGNRWVDVGENRAREKTSQALREGLEVRKSGAGSAYAPNAAAVAAAAGHVPVYPPAAYHPHPEMVSPASMKKRGNADSPDGDSTPGKKKRGRPRKSSPASRAAAAASGAVAQMRQNRAVVPPGYPAAYQGYYPPPPGSYPGYHYPYHAHHPQYAAPAGAGTQEARTAVTGETKCRKCSGILVSARACVPCGHVHCAGCVDVPLAGSSVKDDEDKKDEDAPSSPSRRTGAKTGGGDTPKKVKADSDDEGGTENKEISEGEKRSSKEVKCPTCAATVTSTVPLECLDRIISSCVSGQMADFTLEELEGYERRWKEMSTVASTTAETAEGDKVADEDDEDAAKEGEEEGKGEEQEEEGVGEQEVV